jgi:hypothetical protein
MYLELIENKNEDSNNEDCNCNISPGTIAKLHHIIFVQLSLNNKL